MFERTWRPASSQSDCFLKARKHPLQGHFLSVSFHASAIPKFRSERPSNFLLFITKTELFLRMAKSDGESPIYWTGGKKKNKQTKPNTILEALLRLFPANLPQTLQTLFLNLGVSELGCFPDTISYLVSGQCGKQISFSSKLVYPLSGSETYFRSLQVFSS